MPNGPGGAVRVGTGEGLAEMMLLVNGAIGLAVVWSLVVGGLYVGQRRILYVPDTATPDRHLAGLSDMEVVTLDTKDGLRLSSWYRPAAPGRPTLVYLHGNGGHIAYRKTKARLILDRGFGLLMVGYRGYGGNPGTPTEEGLGLDAMAAVGFLRDEGIEPASTVMYGESLGTGVAVATAATLAEKGTPVAAVVLEAPYASIAEEAARRYWYVPVNWLLHDRFDSVDRVADIDAPLLVVHGERDRVIPVSAGKELFARAREPKRLVLVPEAAHNDLHEHGLIEKMTGFLGEHLGP